jgi:hypothetical protein
MRTPVPASVKFRGAEDELTEAVYCDCWLMIENVDVQSKDAVS